MVKIIPPYSSCTPRPQGIIVPHNKTVLLSADSSCFSGTVFSLTGMAVQTQIHRETETLYIQIVTFRNTDICIALPGNVYFDTAILRNE
jgi:hypothetical protein